MNSDALQELIQTHLPKAQEGDRAAFGRIVVGCQSGITSIAMSIVRDVPASEDIAQDAFLSAWSNLPRLRKPGSFLPWLRQITRNLARDHLRRKKTDRRAPGDFEDVLAVVADPSPGHASRIEQIEQREALAELMDELPDDTRELLLIYYREGQNSRQVADLLGLQDAAVRKRLQRARDRLRGDLLQRLGHLAVLTAPTAAFTAVVVAGLALPGTAAAATGLGVGIAQGFSKFGVASTSFGKLLPKWIMGLGFAGKSAPKLLLGAAGGVLLALIVSFASLIFGLRQYWTTAIDDEEKRGLLKVGLIGGVIVLVFCALMFAAVMAQSTVLPTLAFVGLLVALGALNLSLLPRVLARRHAIQARRDPHFAALARRTERRNAIFGMLLGLVLGGAGLVFGLMAT